MKKVLVLALAVVMALCSLTLVGCGEGVSYEDFKEKTASLKAVDPEYTQGSIYFCTGKEGEYGPNIDFKFAEDGTVEVLSNVPEPDQVALNIANAISNAGKCAWDVKEYENKNEKTDNGTISKTTVVYTIDGELSLKIEDYMKTSKGNEQTTSSYRKYDRSTGYIVEYVRVLSTGTASGFKLVWKAE